MIARLSGTLLDKNPPYMVIDVNGVGYEVEAPTGVFSDLPANGQQVAIVIHHHFCQDHQTLYGFASLGERELFRKLLKISGIGAKMALTILSGASGEELARYVSSGDVAALVRMPGIGKKPQNGSSWNYATNWKESPLPVAAQQAERSAQTRSPRPATHWHRWATNPQRSVAW